MLIYLVAGIWARYNGLLTGFSFLHSMIISKNLRNFARGKKIGEKLKTNMRHLFCAVFLIDFIYINKSILYH